MSGRKNKAGSTASRRQVLVGLGATGAFMAAAPAILAQSRAPIKIAAVNSFSKTFAKNGFGCYNGMQLYLDEIGWQMAGRKVELTKEDDEINPQIGLEKLRKVVESDKVDFVSGPAASNVAMAWLGYAKESKAFILISGAAAEAVTQKRLPYLFRTSLATSQEAAPAAQWIYDNLAKEIVLTCSDYAGGHDVVDTFKPTYLKLGGKILKEIYPPLGTNDFSAYLAQIKSIAPPATYNFYTGTDAVRFVKQYDEFGLKDKIKETGWGSIVDADTLPGTGKSALGIITSNLYLDTLDTPENKAFVAAYGKKYKGAAPSVHVDYGYTTAKVIDETVKLTGGDTSNKDKMAEALLSVKFNDPRGPISFDPVSHNIIQDIYICQSVEAEGRIVNKAIATYKAVRATTA